MYTFLKKNLAVGVFLFSCLSLSQMITTLASVKHEGKEVVTTRAVHIDSVIESILYSKPALKDVLKSRLDSRVMRSELDRYLIEKIVFFESKSFTQVRLANDEIKNATVKIKNEISKNADLKELWAFLTMSDSELQSVVTHKLTAKKFIEFKNKSSFIPATDAEAFSYYQNNKSKFGDMSFESLKLKIKDEISKEQSDQRLNDWLDILKRKYEVTLISPG